MKFYYLVLHPSNAYISLALCASLIACSGNSNPKSDGATSSKDTVLLDGKSDSPNDGGVNSDKGTTDSFTEDTNLADGLGGDGKQDGPSCTPQCTGKQCGPDPVCGISCGTCANGSCDVQGKCIVGGSGPKILSLTANVSAMTEAKTLIISAIVTDPDGIDDVIGGVLEVPTGANSYGAFITSASEGAYTISLTWNAIKTVEAINAPQGGVTRTFRARFYDSAGNNTTKDLPILLQCHHNGSFGLCNGFCADFMTSDLHCGKCKNPVPTSDFGCINGKIDCKNPKETNCGGTCVDLSYSKQHCGKCNNVIEAPYVCRDGKKACQDSKKTLCGTECLSIDSDVDNCGACGRKCNTVLNSVWSACDQGSCFTTNDPTDDSSKVPRSCDEVCQDMGLVCRPYDASRTGKTENYCSHDSSTIMLETKYSGCVKYHTQYVNVPVNLKTCSDQPKGGHWNDNGQYNYFDFVFCLCWEK